MASRRWTDSGWMADPDLDLPVLFFNPSLQAGDGPFSVVVIPPPAKRFIFTNPKLQAGH